MNQIKVYSILAFFLILVYKSDSIQSSIDFLTAETDQNHQENNDSDYGLDFAEKRNAEKVLEKLREQQEALDGLKKKAFRYISKIAKKFWERKGAHYRTHDAMKKHNEQQEINMAKIDKEYEYK